MIFTDHSSKKGQLNVFLLLFGLVVIGFLVYIITAGVGNNLIQELNDEVSASDDFGTEAKGVLSDLASRNHQAWDNAFVMLAGFLIIGAFLAGALIRQSPVILIMLIITIFLTSYVGMNIVNFFEDLTAETTDSLDFATYYPKASFILGNLALYLIGMVLLFGVGVWASERIGI